MSAREDDDAALEALLDYQVRYAAVLSVPFKPGKLDVVGSVAGNRTTDFGAPAVDTPWDAEAITTRATSFDRSTVLRTAGRTSTASWLTRRRRLRKGPRGGGRDRDAIVPHVREAERHYCSKLGSPVPPRTPWDEQRARSRRRCSPVHREECGPRGTHCDDSPGTCSITPGR